MMKKAKYLNEGYENGSRFSGTFNSSNKSYPSYVSVEGITEHNFVVGKNWLCIDTLQINADLLEITAF